jgi:hypothetical protein
METHEKRTHAGLLNIDADSNKAVSGYHIPLSRNIASTVC